MDLLRVYKKSARKLGPIHVCKLNFKPSSKPRYMVIAPGIIPNYIN